MSSRRAVPKSFPEDADVAPPPLPPMALLQRPQGLSRQISVRIRRAGMLNRLVPENAIFDSLGENRCPGLLNELRIFQPSRQPVSLQQPGGLFPFSASMSITQGPPLLAPGKFYGFCVAVFFGREEEECRIYWF